MRPRRFRCGAPLLAALLVLGLLVSAFLPVPIVRLTAQPSCLWDPGVPKRAYEVEAFARSHNFAAPPGLKGNRAFRNDQLRLPPWYGPFREYDLDVPAPGAGRSAERIVLGWFPNASWYTPDHYGTFILMWPLDCVDTSAFSVDRPPEGP